MTDEASMVDSIIESLISMDESMVKNDFNAVLRKIHECLAFLKNLKGEVHHARRFDYADSFGSGESDGNLAGNNG